MKKRTALTILAFVLLIAAIAVPSVLLTQKAAAAVESPHDKYGDFSYVESGPYGATYVITSTEGWRLFIQHIRSNDGGEGRIYNLLDDVEVPASLAFTTDTVTFKGSLIGNMNTVTINGTEVDGTNGDREPDYRGGLFSFLYGSVSDLNIMLNGNFTYKVGYGQGAGQNVGLLAGNIDGGIVTRVALLKKDDNSAFNYEDQGPTSNDLDMGTLCGYADGGSYIYEIYSNVPVKANRVYQGGHNYVGGIIGSLSDITVRDCLAENSVYVNLDAGGSGAIGWEIYTAGLIGNIRSGNRVSYCVANNPRVYTSYYNFYFNSYSNAPTNDSVMAGATTGGGVFQSGVYCSEATREAVRCYFYAGRDRVTEKVFGFSTAKNFVTTTSSSLEDVTTAADLINAAANASRWEVRDGAIALTWMDPQQPSATYNRSRMEVTIKRDLNYTLRELFYNLTMFIQGKMATPDSAESTSEEPTITSAKLYRGATAKETREAIVSADNFVPLPETASDAGVTANKVDTSGKLYLLAEFSGTNLDDEFLGDVNVSWTLTNATVENSKSVLVVGGVLDWENLPPEFTFSNGDTIKVTVSYTVGDAAAPATADGYFAINDKPKELKAVKSPPAYLVSGQEFTLDMYEVTMYSGASGEVKYEVVGKSSAGTSIDATGKLTLGADEVGVAPVLTTGSKVLKLKAVCADDLTKFIEFEIPVKQVPLVEISGGAYTEMWYHMDAVAEKNTLTAAPKNAEDNYVAPFSYTWTVTINGETISATQGTQSAVLNDSVLVVPVSKNTVAEAGELVFSVVMNYKLADGTQKSTAAVTKVYKVRPTATLGVYNPITEAGTYDCISQLTGGATGTVTYSVTPANQGVSISTVDGIGKLEVGNDPTQGVYTVSATWSSVKDKTGKVATVHGDNPLTATINIGTAAITSDKGATIPISNTATTATLTVACNPEVLQGGAGAQWTWVITPLSPGVTLSGSSGNTCTVNVGTNAQCGEYTVTATALRSDDDGVAPPEQVTATYSFEVVPGGAIAFAGGYTILPKGTDAIPKAYAVTIPGTEFMGGTTGTWTWTITNIQGVSFENIKGNVWEHNENSVPTVFVLSSAVAGAKGTLTGTYAYKVGSEGKTCVYTKNFTVADIGVTPTIASAWQSMEGLVNELPASQQQDESVEALGTALPKLFDLEPVVVAAADEEEPDAIHNDRCLGTNQNSSTVRMWYPEYNYVRADDINEFRVAYFKLYTSKPTAPIWAVSVAGATEISGLAGNAEAGTIYMDSISTTPVENKGYPGCPIPLDVSNGHPTYYLAAWVSTNIELKEGLVGDLTAAERFMADSDVLVWELNFDADTKTYKVTLLDDEFGKVGEELPVAEVSTALPVEDSESVPYPNGTIYGKTGSYEDQTYALGTINRNDGWFNNAWEEWTYYNNYLIIDIRKLLNSVYPNQYKDRKIVGDLRVDAWLQEDDKYTTTITMGDKPIAPYFTPSASGVIDYSSGITIGCNESDVTIYYKVYNKDYDALSEDEKTITPQTGTVYIPGTEDTPEAGTPPDAGAPTKTEIVFPLTDEYLTVIAISKNAKGVSLTKHITYSNANRQGLPEVTAQVEEGEGEKAAFAPAYEYARKGLKLYLGNALFDNYAKSAEIDLDGVIYYSISREENGLDPYTYRSGFYSYNDYLEGKSIDLPEVIDDKPLIVKAIYVTNTVHDKREKGTLVSEDEKRLNTSKVSTFNFTFMSTLSLPELHSAYTDESNKVNVGDAINSDIAVADGQEIAFVIPDSNFTADMLPVRTSAGQVAVGIDETSTDARVKTEPAEDSDYTESYLLLNKNYVAPIVKYRFAYSESELAESYNEVDYLSSWRTYTPERPKVILYSGSSGAYVQDFVLQAINPEAVRIEGEPGDVVYVQAYLDGTNTGTPNSELLTRKFTIRSMASSPSADPYDKEKVPQAVSVGDTIRLITNTKNTTIFYTLTNTEVNYEARIEWDSQYNAWLQAEDKDDTEKNRKKFAIESGKAEPSTYMYGDEAINVVKNSSMYIYINAVEVSDGDFDDDPYLMGTHSPGDPAEFRFSINKLTPLTEVKATPSTDATNPTELARGSTVILSNESNTKIYYTTDGSSPSVEDRVALEEAVALAAEYGEDKLTDTQKELVGAYYADGEITMSTKVYNPSTKVVMDPQDEDTVMIINAIAVEKNGVKENSPMATFYYQLGKVEPVEATVVEIESNGEVTTLAPGETISLRSSTPGAEIYYTTDSTVPDPDSYGEAGSTTLKYDVLDGIVMPKDVSTFFTVRAVAVTPLNEDGYRSHADSDLATFIYQLPAPVQAVYSAPVAGSVVKDTEVTLKTTTEGATIYYETGKASDLKANSSQTFEEGTPIVIDKNTTIYTMAVKNGVESEVTTFKFTVAPTLPTPTPSIPTGSMVGNGTSVKLTSQTGATIVYTTDGSDPKKADNANLKYGDTVLLSGSAGATVNVQAYATMTGYTPSEIMTATYTIATAEGYLTVSPASGTTVANGTAVNMTTTLSGSTIHYTTDGTDPTAASPAGNSVTLSGEPGATVNLKVSVFDASGNPGITTLATYTIQAKASAPSSTVESGAYFMDGAAIKLTAAEGLIYYTTDGSDPTASSSLYGDITKLGSDITAYPDIKLRNSVVVKAMAVVEGKANSDIAQFTYTKAGQAIAPVFSKSSGEIDQNEAIGLTTSTEGASIYYTTRGTDPDPSDLSSLTLYTGPITITRPVTIKAIAVKDQMHASVVNSATYTVKVPEPQEEDGAAGDVPEGTDTGRLASRRTYSDTDTGPKYSDVRISNAEFGMVVSSEKGTIPADCELVITEVTPGSPDRSSVSGVTDYSVAQLYEIKLMRNGEEVQPEGEIEIGMPIDAEYQNATLEIIQINANGTAQELDTRRAGGMAYVTTGSLNRVAITMPEDQIKKSNTWIWVAAVGGAGLLAGGTALGVMSYRNKHKGKTAKPGAGPKPGQQPRPQPPVQTPPQPPQGR